MIGDVSGRTSKRAPRHMVFRAGECAGARVFLHESLETRRAARDSCYRGSLALATLNVTNGEPSAVDAARLSQAQSLPPLAIGLLGCAFFLSGVAGLAFETARRRRGHLARSAGAQP
jgi:hypothetical protein